MRSGPPLMGYVSSVRRSPVRRRSIEYVLCPTTTLNEGHGFSRAVNGGLLRALAPEARLSFPELNARATLQPYRVDAAESPLRNFPTKRISRCPRPRPVLDVGWQESRRSQSVAPGYLIGYSKTRALRYSSPSPAASSLASRCKQTTRSATWNRPSPPVRLARCLQYSRV
jgi:hypothetical protein